MRKSGVSVTLFGRRRPIPDINSRNGNARGFAERTAVNTPLQGTAADLIKLAMIHIDQEIDARKLQTKMLLQVHDELLFEAPEAEVEATIATLKPVMEKATLPAVQLSVPLVVDAGAGDNWGEAH